jgi:hypothetical protein
MAGIENPLSVDQVEPHDEGTGPQLLGNVEAALASLKGSSVLDPSHTVEAMELIMVELRAEIHQGASAEFAEAAVRSVVAHLTEAPTNLHQSTPGLPVDPSTSH